MDRRNVTPDKVTKSYEGCEQFLLSVGKAYLLEAALEFWGMESIDDNPTKHVPPKGIKHMSLNVKKDYFNEKMGNTLELEFCLLNQPPMIFFSKQIKQTQTLIILN